MNDKIYIAHRGLHNDNLWAPENSAEACRRAIFKGFPIEIDIHLTKDYQLAVFHDDNLYRMTGVNGKITDYTMEELKNLRLNDTSEKIPTLTEILKIVNGKVPLYIEIKNSTFPVGKLEKILKKAMQYYRGEWVVMSFNSLRLKWCVKNIPNIPRCQLVPITNIKKSIIKKLLQKLGFNNLIYKSISKPQYLGYNLKDLSMKSVVDAISVDSKLIGWTAKTHTELTDAEKFCNYIMFENFIP